MSVLGVLLFLLILLLAVGIYLIPTIIAASRDHRNTAPIAVVNIFLGWTFIGWILALVWSLTDNVTRKGD